MTDVPVIYVPYGEPGAGEYGKLISKQSFLQIDAFKDQMMKAVESVPNDGSNKDGNGLFTIADYGTNDGSASIPLLGEMIALIRKKRGQIPIQIIYEDQPLNDFNSLFRRIYGLIPDPPTYLHDFQDVYVMTTGTSYFQQAIPDNTADFIMSLLAIEWLSKEPTKFQNAINQFPDASEEEKELTAIQAAEDWETFLLHRAKELKSGGMLVVSSTCSDPEQKYGRYITSEDFLSSVLKMWKRFRDEGKITNEEFVNTNINCYSRSLEEFKAPFEDSSSAVYKAGLRLVTAQYVQTQWSVLREWRDKLDKEGVDDRTILARALFTQHRCWSNTAFMQGLAGTRSQAEKNDIVGELFARLEEEVTSRDPKEFKNLDIVSYVVARKL